MKNLILKKDTYKYSRGKWSRFYDISCRKCGCNFAIYQKDGPGELRRLYIDRLCPLIETDSKNKDFFECPKCLEVLGMKYLYEKENRPAIRLFVGAVIKGLHKK